MVAASSAEELEMVEKTLLPVLMCQAAASGDRQLLVELLTGGADASAHDYDGRTALHLAAAEGHTALVHVLIDHQANVLAKDRWGIWLCSGCFHASALTGGLQVALLSGMLASHARTRSASSLRSNQIAS